VLDRLNGLKWDKTPRLDTWLTRHMGAPDTPYVRAVGRKGLIGLGRRIRSPGCKLDSTMVLEGEQEIGKSLMCKDLASFFGDDLFSDAAMLTLDGKEQQELLTGVLIVELSELESLSKADLEKVKAFLTRQSDRGRPAYGTVVVDRLRMCIFIASTNKRNYLTDHSGNRRWWPVAVTKYDREAFLQDLDQLLAEAAHYEAEGESLYLPREVKEAARAEQQARMVRDGWADLLADIEGGPHAAGREARVASKWLLGTVLELPADKHTHANLTRLAQAMRALGWDGPHDMRIDGHGSTRGYRRAVTP
jgi:predicted P-loop ATPase